MSRTPPFGELQPGRVSGKSPAFTALLVVIAITYSISTVRGEHIRKKRRSIVSVG
ncbi:MAG: hypothetical protein KME18_07780 [Phormidium tanganyikae FI6-MK23]|nr:hypothetical protein [Phormidium tanganyikae FI6-MK23]